MTGKCFSSAAIQIFAIVIIIGGIFIGGIIYFKNNISEIMPPENMEIFLEKKDICTIL